MIGSRIAMATFVAIAFMSCQHKSADDSTSAVSIAHDTLYICTPSSPLFGHLGEDSGMSAWQLLTDKGDTLELTLQDEHTGQYAVLNGDFRNYTDRFAVFVNEDSTAVTMAINMTQLGKR